MSILNSSELEEEFPSAHSVQRISNLDSNLDLLGEINKDFEREESLLTSCNSLNMRVCLGDRVGVINTESSRRSEIYFDVEEKHWRGIPVSHLQHVSALVLAAGVANFMTPVYLEHLEDNGLSVEGFILPAILGTASTLALTSTAFEWNDDWKDKNLKGWKRIAYISAVFSACSHVFLLWEIESNHSLDMGLNGWSSYQTFAVIGTPFLGVFYGRLFAQNMNYLFRSKRDKFLDSIFNLTSDDSIKILAKQIREREANTLDAPDIKFGEVTKLRKGIGLVSALAVFPGAFMVGNFVVDETLKKVGVETEFSYVFGTIAAAFISAQTYKNCLISPIDAHDIYSVPFAAFQSLPMMALSYESMAIWSKPASLTNTILFSLGTIFNTKDLFKRSFQKMIFGSCLKRNRTSDRVFLRNHAK